MPYMDRYQLEVLEDKSVVLHDNFLGQVVESFAGLSAFQDASDLKYRLDLALTDEMLWEWICD